MLQQRDRGGERMRGAADKEEKDEARVNAALGPKKRPGMRDAAIRFS